MKTQIKTGNTPHPTATGLNENEIEEVLAANRQHISWLAFKVSFSTEDKSKAAELERITKAIATIVDAAIHETPEQWFWYNRRWVLDPVV